MFYPYYSPFYNPYPYWGGYGGFGGRNLAFPFLTGFLLGELFW
jgi:hypothetical protein